MKVYICEGCKQDVPFAELRCSKFKNQQSDKKKKIKNKIGFYSFGLIFLATGQDMNMQCPPDIPYEDCTSASMCVRAKETQPISTARSKTSGWTNSLDGRRSGAQQKN